MFIFQTNFLLTFLFIISFCHTSQDKKLYNYELFIELSDASTKDLMFVYSFSSFTLRNEDTTIHILYVLNLSKRPSVYSLLNSLALQLDESKKTLEWKKSFKPDFSKTENFESSFTLILAGYFCLKNQKLFQPTELSLKTYKSWSILVNPIKESRRKQLAAFLLQGMTERQERLLKYLVELVCLNEAEVNALECSYCGKKKETVFGSSNTNIGTL